MPDAGSGTGSGSDEDSPLPMTPPTQFGGPRGTSPPKGIDSYFKTADHSALSSLSQLPSPIVSADADYGNGNGHSNAHNRMGSFPFPLLPPHHPLRGQMYSTPINTGEAGHINGDSSPATTPKGHPLEPKSRYPKDLKVS